MIIRFQGNQFIIASNIICILYRRGRHRIFLKSFQSKRYGDDLILCKVENVGYLQKRIGKKITKVTK